MLSDDLFNWRDKDKKKPLDKILCHRKFYRYVVACMHNCPEPHFCREFWNFFEAKGLTPAEYYNEDGIGDQAMRRVVFDCDRCGKKDIDEVFGLYSVEGEAPEYRLTPEEEQEAAASTGYKDPVIGNLAYRLLEQIEEQRGWQHYCRRCFQKVNDNIAQILNQKRPKPGNKKKTTPKVEELPKVKKEKVEKAKPAASKKGKSGGKKRKANEAERDKALFGDTA